MRVVAHKSPDGSPPESKRFKIWEAARATSAAPLYYDEAQIDGKRYWDGAMTHNNPILQVWDEKILHYKSAPVSCVISLGTGFQSECPETDDSTHGNFQIIRATVAMITDTESKHHDFQKTAQNEDTKYHRLNPRIGAETIGLADFEKLDLLEKYTKAYMERHEIKEAIKDCATSLLPPLERSRTKKLLTRLTNRKHNGCFP